MLTERIEAKWIDVFREVFDLCRVAVGDEVVILSESQSRQINVQLAELALLALGAKVFHLILPSPRLISNVPVRSTGSPMRCGIGPQSLQRWHALPWLSI